LCGSVVIKGLKIETISVQKIPPNPCLPDRQVPLPKGGISAPSLEKRGEGRFSQCISYFETVNMISDKALTAHLIISRELLEQVIAHCRSAYPIEACGLLAGTDNRAEKMYAMTNVEPSNVSYMMDPGEQFKAMKEMRKNGTKMVAIFHSHPHSPAYLFTQTPSIS
jgi:hypothetical protein